jgi:hypothetical protein
VLLDQLVVEEVAVAGHGADNQLIAIFLDVAQVVELAQVYQGRGHGKPEPHERYQGVSTGYEPSVLSVLVHQIYGVVDRLGDLVVKGCGMHY